MASKRRSSRQMESRKRSRYTEPETEDELMSWSDDDSDVPLPRELDDSPRPRKQVRSSNPRHRPKTRSKSTAAEKAKSASAQRRRRTIRGIVIGRPNRARADPHEGLHSDVFKGPTDGIKPPWATLPMEILKDIFVFGSQPLTPASVSWLLNAARTCKAFMIPALDALYYSPQIWSPEQLWRLLSLMQQREGRIMNYNTKVRRLDLDVRRLAYTARKKPLFNLAHLIAELPMLQHLEIVHPSDAPPFRSVQMQRWEGMKDVLDPLLVTTQRLKGWRWTRNLLKDNANTGFLHIVHSLPAFHSLRELVICGFSDEVPVVNVLEDVPPSLWAALSVLPHLRDVTFISCGVVREAALTLLPSHLERLELSNCSEVNSDVLAQYLVAGGAQLKELVLLHNPALDLAFLPGLKQNCPRLEVLEVSFKFYSELQASNNAEPLYDELLADDEIPSWPSTMRELDLRGMQKCSASGAKNLFQSLVDSAPELPVLRFIVLHSHIDLPWRDRATFRDHWTDTLMKTFKRPERPPFAYNGSHRQYRLWKDKKTARVAPQQSISSSQPVVPAAASGEASGPSQRRSQRVAAVQQLSSALEESRLVESSDEDAVTLSNDATLGQGLCDVVDVQIDAKRPREVEFTERDFLDDEASGDEDWNGNENATQAEGNGYAW